MRRLRKLNNHVSRDMHEYVEKSILDKEKNKRLQSSDSYLLAKKIIGSLPIAHTNEHLLKVMLYIDSGKYKDLGSNKDNFDKWLQRTKELLIADKVLLCTASKYDIHDILNKLSRAIPIVPIKNTLLDLYQDIKFGLFDDCGDPDKDFDKWVERAKELLTEKGILYKK